MPVPSNALVMSHPNHDEIDAARVVSLVDDACDLVLGVANAHVPARLCEGYPEVLAKFSVGLHVWSDMSTISSSSLGPNRPMSSSQLRPWMRLLLISSIVPGRPA